MSFNTCPQLCNCYIIKLKTALQPQELPLGLLQAIGSYQPQPRPQNLFSVPRVLPLLEWHYTWAHAVWSLLYWLLSFIRMLLRFVPIRCIGLFLFIAEWWSMVWMNHPRLMRALVDGHLDFFQFVAVTNQAVINICAQVSAWTYVHSFLLHHFSNIHEWEFWSPRVSGYLTS